MPRVQETVDTRLPLEAVFDYVANFETIQEWDPGVVSSTKLTDGPLAVGTAYRIVVQYGGRPQEMTYTVAEMDRPRLVVLEGDGSRTRALDRIEFSAADGGTRVDYRADIELKGMFRAATPFLGKLFSRIGEGARRGLTKRLAELEAGEERSR